MQRDDLFIAATVDRVWDLTVDVERWPETTPTITSVERLDAGPLAVGSRARLRQPGMRPAVWTVEELEPGRRFRWSTRLGTVRMTASHDLEAVEGGCRNVLTLEMSGFGSRLLERLVGRRIGEAIATENQGFRTAAEGVAGTAR